MHTDEFLEGFSILLRDLVGVASLSESKVKSVVTVVLPDTLEVGLIAESGSLLVREDKILLLDQFWGELRKGVPLLLESLTTLRGSSINAKINRFELISMGERVKSAMLLTFVILV